MKYSSLVSSNINDVLIELTDKIGFNDSSEHLEAFNTALRKLDAIVLSVADEVRKSHENPL